MKSLKSLKEHIKELLIILFNSYQLISFVLTIGIIAILFFESLDISNYPRLWANLELKRTSLAMLIFIVPNFIYIFYKALFRMKAL